DSDRDDVVVAPGAHVGGVQPHIGPFAFDGAVEEGLYALVDLGAEPRNLALADPFHAHGADQIVHRARGDALDVSLLDHLLGTASAAPIDATSATATGSATGKPAR